MNASKKPMGWITPIAALSSVKWILHTDDLPMAHPSHAPTLLSGRLVSFDVALISGRGMARHGRVASLELGLEPRMSSEATVQRWVTYRRPIYDSSMDGMQYSLSKNQISWIFDGILSKLNELI
uniref:Uncharacterized protein n=1 Tax=Panagrellus redivivus TaxID=6233 RepID=A0A7E4ZXD0_PANRE